MIMLLKSDFKTSLQVYKRKHLFTSSSLPFDEGQLFQAGLSWRGGGEWLCSTRFSSSTWKWWASLVMFSW